MYLQHSIYCSLGDDNRAISMATEITASVQEDREMRLKAPEEVSK